MSGFERLLNPRGIAVVGASTNAARPGGQTVEALRQYGFRGGVYPVNPKYKEVAGYPCHATLERIEGDCDLAVIALPAEQVPATIAQCADRGIGFAVVLGGGFREAGEHGARTEAKMLAVAHERGVRIVGPNCLGFVNVHTSAYAAFGSLTRPPQLKPGSVSAVLQSASLGTSLLIQCGAAGAEFRYVVTSGNEADISAPEWIDAYIDDTETKIVLAYVEGIGDGRAFMRSARRALDAQKPIVLIKAGNTEQGRRAAASHTANLTGDYDVYRAAFRQCGVIEVQDIHEAVDMVMCLATDRLPKGRRVVVMGGSGGAAAMYSDHADRKGLKLPPLSTETLDRLKTSLPELSSLKNPIDYTAGYPREEEGLDFKRAFETALADPRIDQMAVMFAAAGRNQLRFGGEVLAKVAAASAKPIVVFSAMTEALAPEGLGSLRTARIPVLPSPKRVAGAMARLADYAEALERGRQSDAMASSATIRVPELPSGPATLSETASKRLIAAASVPVTNDWLLPLEPGPACDNLSYPLVLKIVSPDVAHKTDVGAVRLGIADSTGLATAAREIVTNVRRAMPHARLDGLLASEMISDGVEVIVGVVNDAVFGPVVALGLGGVLTEVMRDVTYRVAPFGLEEAHTMLAELKGRAIFDGVRGRHALDVEALAGTLARISELGWAMRDRLAEMDINPLLVRPRGYGVVAADAFVVLRASPGAPSPAEIRERRRAPD
jgi:acetate---CoA ligase (ADP-forming)